MTKADASLSAFARSGSARTLSPSCTPGRYFTFSFFSLMISVSGRPSTYENMSYECAGIVAANWSLRLPRGHTSLLPPPTSVYMRPASLRQA